jgi:hypothetical protein
MKEDLNHLWVALPIIEDSECAVARGQRCNTRSPVVIYLIICESIAVNCNCLGGLVAVTCTDRKHDNTAKHSEGEHAGNSRSRQQSGLEAVLDVKSRVREARHAEIINSSPL